MRRDAGSTPASHLRYRRTQFAAAGLLLSAASAHCCGRLRSALGRCCLESALGLPLEDPDRVAEGVADLHVGPVEVVGGLLDEVGYTALLQGFVQTADVVSVEDQSTHCTLGEQLAELGSGGFVLHRRPWLLQVDVDARLAGDANRQPAVFTLFEILALLQPELVDVEVESRFLVEDPDGRDAQLGDHRLFFSCARFEGDEADATKPPPPSRLQNCSIASPLPPPPPAAWPPSGRSEARPSAHVPRGSPTAPRR